MTDDARLEAPSVARNRAVIGAALRGLLPERGVLLEIASGSGEHAAYLAPSWPDLAWQPTDHDPAARASIDAWCAGIANIRPALALDATRTVWPLAAADAVLCINMIHIAPWAATVGLLRGTAAVLSAGAPLILYGPFRRGNDHTAPTNAEFDADLRARNPEWGVRDLEAIAAVAADVGFDAPDPRAMPANNLLVILMRGSGKAA